jgi:thiamine biosynthesis lipoprotein
VNGSFIRSEPLMGTIVTITVPARERAAGLAIDQSVGHSVERAFGWFREIERSCSRFDPQSEVRRLARHAGEPVRVSEALFESVTFALAVAEESGGAFDPAIGARMEACGFSTHYVSGEDTSSAIAPGDPVSWRDVHVDSVGRTVTLAKPIVLDLGAVAKGLAVDMAARELAPLEDFGVDAGGDLYLGGHNTNGEPWSVGIRHPRTPGALIATLRVSGTAVCTSGDYERPASSAAVGGSHHILDARTGASARELASVTVVAPTAMVADAFATAAFALGMRAGCDFLDRQGVQALLVTPSLERIEIAARATGADA